MSAITDAWFILAAWLGLVAVLIGARALHLWLRNRRKDREWFAWIASKPRGAEALEWLRGGPDVWRLGCLRTAAPAPDAELEQWEREEWERMETFYGLDGVNPYEKRRTTGGLS